MSYSEITFGDKNPVKRWLQHRRLVSALAAAGRPVPSPSLVCDFGAGNGELCKSLVKRFPRAGIICYEPEAGLLDEARQNLKGMDGIDFCRDVRYLEKESVDLLFSLEVFEHLPQAETETALQRIVELLKADGRAVIGVPVEIGIPALYKGLFRMARRYGAFDADPGNIFKCLAGKPPKHRPVGEIAPGLNYYFEHLGFDYRRFMTQLVRYFKRPVITSSPFPVPGPRLMPEIYFTMEKS
jgi:SAM-dependent methyltransferase